MGVNHAGFTVRQSHAKVAKSKERKDGKAKKMFLAKIATNATSGLVNNLNERHSADLYFWFTPRRKDAEIVVTIDLLNLFAS